MATKNIVLVLDGTLSPDFRIESAAPAVFAYRQQFSPVSLRESDLGRRYIQQHRWYDQFPWATTRMDERRYVVDLPAPGTREKTFAEQCRELPDGSEPAPLVLVMQALLCLRVSGRPDPLYGAWVRCMETVVTGRVTVGWMNGRLRVGVRDENARHDRLWLASVRTDGDPVEGS